MYMDRLVNPLLAGQLDGDAQTTPVQLASPLPVRVATGLPR